MEIVEFKLILFVHLEWLTIFVIREWLSLSVFKERKIDNVI